MQDLIKAGMEKRVPATGLGLFRIFFGLVILQEILFLFYFRHLVFDPVPFSDMASPLLPWFLGLWAIAVIHLIIGRHTRIAATVNYLFWIVFTVFTPMWQDFDGGFDQLMIGSSLLLIFLPSEKALSIDNLSVKLGELQDGTTEAGPTQVPVLSYYLPLALSLGLLYFDSGVHKLFAEFWRNGLGVWLPSSMPYYMSGIDLTWFLNIKPLQMFIGYLILVFEFVFVFVCYFRWARIPLMLVGAGFHIGIILSFNIYPFGFGMLVHFLLMVPFVWWRRLAGALTYSTPTLTVIYKSESPRAQRTALVWAHFDLCKGIKFVPSENLPPPQGTCDTTTNRWDLVAVGPDSQTYEGFDVYVEMMLKMRYTALIGVLFRLPGVYQLARRFFLRRQSRQARSRLQGKGPRLSTSGPANGDAGLFYQRSALPMGHRRIYRLLVGVLILQINSTVHYGILDRLDIDSQFKDIAVIPAAVSNSLIVFSHTFFGITPHGLYTSNHFDGYNHIFAFTYKDRDGQERWLPFVDEQGRLIPPNWGRVQSMWANIAVTGNIERPRLDKFVQKVTGFWGTKQGLDLSHCEFTLKMKEVFVPTQWEADLARKNLNQSWRDIGLISWTNGSMRMDIPDIDLGSL